MPEPTTCTACRSPRRLILMASGARWWCDPTPHPDGIVVITALEPDGRVRGRVLSGAELPALDEAYQPHDRTCQASREHARREAIRRPRCPVCSTLLHQLLVDDGIGVHPLCQPVTVSEMRRTG